jgi:RepB DNA-primase N-terminal domain
MTVTTLTAHETVTRFFGALAGRATADELVELRYRLDDGQRMGQLFERPARLRGLATRAIFLGRRSDVYVGCAPRTRRHGGSDSVARAFVLWVDCDGEDAVAALREFEPEPAIVIASGTGSNCHAYWPLSEPLARDDIEPANRRLAHALGADPASADAARILRIPGTLSHKHTPPTPVQALRLNTHRTLTAVDVIGGLPDPPPPARTPAEPLVVRKADPLLYQGVFARHRKACAVEVGRSCDCVPSYYGKVYDRATRGHVSTKRFPTVTAARGARQKLIEVMEAGELPSAAPTRLREAHTRFIDAAREGRVLNKHGRRYKRSAIKTSTSAYEYT